jgi:hypothetical protein
MNIWFCHCEPLVLLDEEELPIYAIKCTSIGQGPYMEASEDFNECCYNSTGEDFKK